MTTYIKTAEEKIRDMLWEDLVDEAERHEKEAHEKIRKAGYEAAVAVMMDFSANDLPVPYVRSFLETINGIEITDDSTDEHDNMVFQYHKEQKRCFKSRYKGDPHRGYTKEFVDKWYKVRF